MMTEQKQQTTKPKWWRTLIKGDYLTKRPRRGEICEATILSIEDHDIFVELDGKRDGLIQREDLDRVDDNTLAQLEAGDRIPVRILRVPYNRSTILVSLKQGLEQQDWIRAKTLKESKEVTQVKVTEENRGGVVTAFGRLRGFIPNSHLVSVPRGVRGKKRREKKAELIGQTLPVIVIEVRARQRRLILSERLAQRRQRKALLEELHEGAIRTGVVRNMTNYGAFLDLGGIDGLLHISELSWEYVEHPRDVLSVGDEVEVYVLDVDRERERISLSRKRLLPSPWEVVTDTLGRGDTVEGKVTNVTSFGLFVDIGKGVEGLVPKSEMPGTSPEQSNLGPGTRVNVQVLNIDPLQERIALRLENVLSQNDTARLDNAEKSGRVS